MYIFITHLSFYNFLSLLFLYIYTSLSLYFSIYILIYISIYIYTYRYISISIYIDFSPIIYKYIKIREKESTLTGKNRVKKANFESRLF